MEDFMGYHNVYNAEPIFGKDGMVDGFNIYYKNDKSYSKGDKWITKVVDSRATVWVRSPEVESDGVCHGFGNGIMISRSGTSKKVKRENAKKEALRRVYKALKKIQ